ncbi:MAG: DUF177 domain-containing protein [Armatimonadetes bacterium]|nr:DUF177 domain-containing protein [Armatimonadota bacterium]
MIMRYAGLSRLRKNLPVQCAIDAPAPEGTGETVLGLVAGEIVLRPTGRTIMAQGQVAVTVELACARCLRPHPVKLDVLVARECCLMQIDDPEAYRERDDDLPPIPILSGDEIDLSELVRQLIILHTPPRSLCRPDCKGLCDQCGADLNEGPCGCQQQGVDPRLAPLKSLLKET